MAKLKQSVEDLHYNDHRIILGEMTGALNDFSSTLTIALREDRKEMMTDFKEILSNQSKSDNSDIINQIKVQRMWMMGAGALFVLGVLIEKIM